MKNILFIRDLKASTTIGVHAWEKQIKRTVFIDLELAVDIEKAAKTDNLEDALDYDNLSQQLILYLAESRFDLIETLAEKIAALILSEFAVSWLRLTLTKPGALACAKSVGVVIERGEHLS